MERKPTGSASLAALERSAQRVIDQDVPFASHSPSHTADVAATIAQASQYPWRLDAVTERATEEAFEGLTDYLHRLANEPSIGLYHCANHIKKAVPVLSDMQMALRGTCKDVDNAVYECTDAARAVCAMHELVAFRNTKDSISRSISTVEQVSTTACEDSLCVDSALRVCVADGSWAGRYCVVCPTGHHLQQRKMELQ